MDFAQSKVFGGDGASARARVTGHGKAVTWEER